MSEYTVATGKRGAYAKTLVAETVDTVTFADKVPVIWVKTNGVKEVYVTVDGSAPTVAGAGTIEIPAAGGFVLIPIKVRSDGGTVVKLISAGTPSYSVSAAAS